jgi:hypothetical protein
LAFLQDFEDFRGNNAGNQFLGSFAGVAGGK